MDEAARRTDAEGRVWLLQPWACPTCGPGPVRTLGQRGGRFHRYGSGIESTIVRCRSCGLLFPDPFVVPEEPQKIYGDPEKYFATHDEAEKIRNHARMLTDLRRRLGGHLSSVLDIGSGRGELLVAAGDSGFRAVGLEFSAAMIDSASDRGLTVLHESAEEHAVGGHTYDAITLASVIEHVYDPDSLVAAVAAMLRVGGIVYVECPNEPHLVSKVMAIANRTRRSPAVINLSPSFSPFHIYGFNATALTTLLNKHGLDVVEVKIWAHPGLRGAGGPFDCLKAEVGTLMQRLANLTSTASNMEVWAVKREV